MDQPFRDGELMLGTFYPRHYVVAVLPTAEQAEQAIAALEAASCGERPRHWRSEDAIARHQEVQGQLNPLQRLGSALAQQEREYVDEYLEHAQRGEHFVTVYTPSTTDVERARVILAEHGGHAMRHYGNRVVTDLAGA